MTYDTIIRGGLWFDGSGAPAAVRDIAKPNETLLFVVDLLEVR